MRSGERCTFERCRGRARVTLAAVRTAPLLVALVAIAIVACEDDKKERLLSKTASEAGAFPTAPPPASTPPAAPTPAPSASTSPDSGAHFDPKHKCPTGQTHFYLEGDFCRRKCITNNDCGKRERCSAIDYPFVLDGGVAGMSKFCEGT